MLLFRYWLFSSKIDDTFPNYDSVSQRKGGASEAGKEEGQTPPPGKLEEMGLNGCWDEDFTKVLNHLSPEAGGIYFNLL